MRSRVAAGFALLVLSVAGPAPAQPTRPGQGVESTSPWTRATPPGADSAAVYLTLKAPTADRILAVSSPDAKAAEVLGVFRDGAVLQMRPVPGGLFLPPGQPVSLQPGGYHIALTGLSRPLKLGDAVPLHISFQVSPAIDVTARVAAVGVSQPPAAGQ